jgi:hypothetical protein
MSFPNIQPKPPCNPHPIDLSVLGDDEGVLTDDQDTALFSGSDRSGGSGFEYEFNRKPQSHDQ